jgi:hypothetical protein
LSFLQTDEDFFVAETILDHASLTLDIDGSIAMSCSDATRKET